MNHFYLVGHGLLGRSFRTKREAIRFAKEEAKRRGVTQTVDQVHYPSNYSTSYLTVFTAHAKKTEPPE